MASNPFHPHDTRNHPGGGIAAAAGEHTPPTPMMASAAAARGTTGAANGPGGQWALGASLPPAPEDMATGRGNIGDTPVSGPHQFGPMVDGYMDEVAMYPAIPAPVLREYSGFEEAMNKSGERMLEPLIVERELKWQREELLAEKPQAQADFKDMMLQQQNLRAFALMSGPSPYITIVHSVGKYFPPIEADSTEFGGQFIGFVGDRKQARSPVPISLPKDVWEWTVPMIYLDYDAVATHYEKEAR